MSSRRVVLVVGSGRSGTSALAGGLQALGMHVPPPEVPADETGLRGSAESQWVVDLHTELLERANVGITDGRPSAWFETGKWAANGMLRTRVVDWFGRSSLLSRPGGRAGAGAQGPADGVVPRSLARGGAALRRDRGVPHDPAARHRGRRRPGPAGGADRGLGQHDAPHRAGHPRLGARLRPVRRPAGRLDDPAVPGRVRARRARGDRGVGQQHAQGPPVRGPGPAPRPPDLGGPRRPARLQEIAEESWKALSGLADAGGDTADRHAALDQLRDAYVALYDEAEGIAASSADAARREGAPGGPETAEPKGLKRLLGR